MSWKKVEEGLAKWKGERGWHTLVTELFWEKASNWTRTENFHSRVLDKEIEEQVRTRPRKSAMLTCLEHLTLYTL